ncbi:MAG: hypothetical protein Q8K82_25620 [Gemmatimonadaceae bacterium]|nr:hypothetical protein [Gemmatimonadaceae bacterium]
MTRVSAAGLLGSVSGVRALQNGSVIVNDVTRRQLHYLDSAYHVWVVIADATAAPGGYNNRFSGLIAYRGDSSLFIDPRALSMAIIDESGLVARVMAIPRPGDADWLITGPFGVPGVDAHGRLVYRGGALVRPGRTVPNPTGGYRYEAAFPDEAPIVRVHLASRAVDTLTLVHVPLVRIVLTERDGRFQQQRLINPMSVTDVWALMPDGRVAVVRGRDYHIEWCGEPGLCSATEKIPYHWERLDDDAKQRIVDSTNVEMEKERARTAAPVAARGRGSSASAVQGSNDRSAPARELPDYRPAFALGAARVDVEGNLWIRTTAPSDMGPIYDVINGKGELVDRVKLPYGRVISGFGPGVVYMGVLDDEGARLEKARIK